MAEESHLPTIDTSRDRPRRSSTDRRVSRCVIAAFAMSILVATNWSRRPNDAHDRGPVQVFQDTEGERAADGSIWKITDDGSNILCWNCDTEAGWPWTFYWESSHGDSTWVLMPLIANILLLGLVVVAITMAWERLGMRRIRWYQLTIGNLLFFMFLTSVILSWGRWHVDRIREKTRLAQLPNTDFRRMNFRPWFALPDFFFPYEYQGLGLSTTELHLPETGPNDLSWIVSLPHLEKLSLSGQQITDEEIKLLAHCRSLKILYLDNTAITDEGLVTLGKQLNLKRLSLVNTKITNDGLRHLESLNHLERLYLSGTQLHGSDLHSLSRLSNLRVLSLARTGITDDALEPLATLRNLERLDIRYSLLKGKGFKNLHGLPNLVEFCYSGCPLTELDLRDLPRLGFVYLPKTVEHLYLLNLPKLASVGTYVDSLREKEDELLRENHWSIRGCYGNDIETPSRLKTYQLQNVNGFELFHPSSEQFYGWIAEPVGGDGIPTQNSL